MYDPHKEVSIDEAMVLFKGRSLFNQYMPQKPIKRGFKLWLRCDPHNGFMSQCEVYSGKDPNGSVETLLGVKVVKSLSKELEGKGYFLFFDNLFSTMSLVEELLDKNFHYIATTRANRRNSPREFKNMAGAEQGNEQERLQNSTVRQSAMYCMERQQVCVPPQYHHRFASHYNHHEEERGWNKSYNTLPRSS